MNLFELDRSIQGKKVAEGSLNEFAPGPKNDGEEPSGNDIDAAYAYIQKNYPSAKKYAVRRANKGFRAIDHPKYRDSGDPAGIDQALVRTSLAHQTGVKDAIKYLQLQLNSNFSGSKDVSFTIGWSWYVFENPKTGIAVLYYADRGLGGDELVVAGKTPQIQAQAREVFRDAGVLPTPTPRKKQGVAEGTETDGWYVLDTKNRKIIANDVSKERASAIAKAGGYSMWQTENGTFINSTRSVRYPGLGWIDVSEGVAEAAGSSSFRKGQKVLIVKQGVIATVTKVDKKWGYITVQTNDGRMAQIDERQFNQIKAYHGPMLSPSVTSEMTELLKNGTSPDEVADIMRLPVEVVAEFMPNRQGVAEGQFNSKQEVVDYFVSKGKSAAAGAGAWERGWRGSAPKKKTPTRPVRSYHDDLDDKRYKSVGEDASTGTHQRRLKSPAPTAGSTRTQTEQARGDDDKKIAGRYDPRDFDAMVQRVGQKAKEQQKRHPVDIADLARRMRATKTK